MKASKLSFFLEFDCLKMTVSFMILLCVWEFVGFHVVSRIFYTLSPVVPTPLGSQFVDVID
jgi:hypothetical protein